MSYKIQYMCSNIQGKKQSQVTYMRMTTEIASIPARSFSEATDYIYTYEMAVQYPSYYKS